MSPDLQAMLRRMTHSTFDAGLVVGRKTPAEANKRRTQLEALNENLVAAYIEGEVQRRVAAECVAADG